MLYIPVNPSEHYYLGKKVLYLLVNTRAVLSKQISSLHSEELSSAGSSFVCIQFFSTAAPRSKNTPPFLHKPINVFLKHTFYLSSDLQILEKALLKDRGNHLKTQKA